MEGCSVSTKKYAGATFAHLRQRGAEAFSPHPRNQPKPHTGGIRGVAWEHTAQEALFDQDANGCACWDEVTCQDLTCE